jgi:hypothetical protein
VGGQRRKRGGRVTPKGGGSTGGLSATECAGLGDIFDRILRSAPKDLIDEIPPLAVELWASQVWAIWASSELMGLDAVDVFAGGLITHAAKRAAPGSLMALRALGAVAPEPYGSRARHEAERLASTGLAERRWAAVVGTGQPMAAWLSRDLIDDDGVSVMVEFDGPGQSSTIGVYIDHNLGGIAKDGFAVPAPIAVVIAKLKEDEEAPGSLDCRKISLEEAAAFWREGLRMTDMTLDPPINEDFDTLRVLVDARLSKLPAGGAVLPSPTMTEDERDELLAQFCESDETLGLFGFSGEPSRRESVEHLAHQILTFSLDYVRGTPLRFSPVMVEIFCMDWAPRKVAVDGDGFTLLPDVLAAWIRFVGRRRSIPEESIAAAVDAVYRYAPEMIELSLDPEMWGPAKTMALAIQQRGIDFADQAALDSFIDEVNRNGGIDVLAESLTDTLAPRW